MFIIAVEMLLVLAACGVLLTFTSQSFADGVSRVFEAMLEQVEYRVALRASRRRREPRRETAYTLARARQES